MAEPPYAADAPPDVPAPELWSSDFGQLSARDQLALLKRASAGNQSSASEQVFRAYYRSYRPYLLHVVSRAFGSLSSSGEIDDIVHDALVAFYLTAVKKFALDCSWDDATCGLKLRAYLGRIARNRANEPIRFQSFFGTRRLDASPAPMDAPWDAVAPASTPEPMTAAERLRQRVRDWVDSLGPRDREVIECYYYQVHFRQNSSARIPDGSAEALARKHRVTTSAIRHAKRKLIAELKAKLTEP